MSNFDNNRFKSSNQDWETPDCLFNDLNNIFNFTRDVCASKDNTKCKDYYSIDDSCLDKCWNGVNWMNPPYKDMKKFIKKAYDERYNVVTVCLIPARTNTNWWHEYCMEGEIWFICGRVKFKGCIHGLPQPLALVIFGTNNGTMQSYYYKKESIKVSL